MKFQIADKSKAELFVNLFLNLKLITENVNLEFLENGLYIQGMDNSQICIYDLNIDKDWFSMYEHTENSNFGINMIILAKILNVRNDNQKITIYDENDKLSIEFESEEKNEINKYFEMCLLEIDQDKMHIPTSEYDINIQFNSKTFKSIVGELSIFSDVVNIYCDDNVYMHAKSIESSMKVELQEENVEELTMTEEGEATNIEFSLKYIYIFSQFHKLDEFVNIHISPDIPIKVNYNFDEKSYCNFYLAPKISD